MSRPADVAAALAEAAKTIDHPTSVEETLDAIVHAARDTIPGLEHVGISILHRNGRIEEGRHGPARLGARRPAVRHQPGSLCRRCAERSDHVPGGCAP